MGLLNVIPTAGLQQRSADLHAPPGSLLTAQNVRQDKNGSLSKRPGNAQLATYQGVAAIDVSKGGALSANGEQLLLTTSAGASAYVPGTASFGAPTNASEALLTRTNLPMPPILDGTGTSNITHTSLITNYAMEPSMCSDGVRFFYVWIIRGSGYLTIQDIATGATIVDRKLIPLVYSPIWMVPIMVGTQLTIVSLLNNGTIYHTPLDTPYDGGFGTAVGIVAGWDTTCNIDAFPVGAGYAVVGSASGATAVFLQLVSAAGVLGTNRSISAAGALEVRMAYSSAQAQIWVGWRLTASSTLYFCAYNSTTLASVLATPVNQKMYVDNFSMCAVGASRVALAYTADVSNAAHQEYVDALLYDSAAGGSVVINVYDETNNVILASRPFVQGGKVYAWVQAYNDMGQGTPTARSWGSSPSLFPGNTPVSQFSNVLVDLHLDVNTNAPMRPVAVDSPRFAFPVANRMILRCINPTLAGTISPLSVAQGLANEWAFISDTRQTPYITTVSLVKASFASPVRWAGARLGSLFVQSSGMVTNWDGEKTIDAGFPTSVGSFSAVSGNTGGSLLPSTFYVYKLVPVFPDAAGNMHRGIPSLTQQTATAAGGTNITLTWSSMMLSASVYGNTVPYPAYWEIYRSQGNAASNGVDVATNFLDIIQNNYTSGAPGLLSYQDGVGDSSIRNNATCYTYGGVLPNVCPPGAWDVCAHQGRAWIIADDRANLYFSKQIVDGEGVNFTDGFTVACDTPTLRALASMDDKLVVFSDSAVYYISGLGPGDNGAGEQFDIPTRIQSPVGCIDRRSVVSFSEGVIFQSGIGLYLLDRGLGISYIGDPVADELAAFPVVTSAVLHPTQPWVYITITTTDGTAGERLVYDYRVKQWYVDTLPRAAISAARTTTKYYWLDTAGVVWVELTNGSCYDAGSWVTMKFETSWNRTADLLMSWWNADRMQMIATRNDACDVVIGIRANYEQAPDRMVVLFDRAQESAPKFPVMESEITIGPGKNEALTFIYYDAAPSSGAATYGKGWTVKGFTFQADEPDGILNRLTPQQRGTPAGGNGP